MDNKTNNLPLVVIFGRPNVGKSTLFNCLTEKRHALVSDMEGTTRDSNIGQIDWQGHSFQLIDTGGILDLNQLTRANSKTRKKIKLSNDVDAKVQEQARDYLKKADLILFMVDVKAGLLPQDKEISMYLKKKEFTNKTFLITNKADSPRLRANAAEFNKLAIADPISISSVTGSGTGDLLDIIIDKLPKHKTKIAKKNNLIKTCILGKPNVGKSSLLNSILGYERVFVSETAHTTREPQDTDINYNNNTIKIIDTAGISKRGRKTKGLEKFGIEKSLAVLGNADIALLILDISKTITRQDAKLIEEIFDTKKSFIIIANKWDLIEEKDTKKYTEHIYGKLPFAAWAPIHFTSALTGSKVHRILDLILELDKNRKIKLGNSQLNKFLLKIVKMHPPAKAMGTKRPRIYEITQYHVNPPKFEIRIGAKDTLHFSYVRFIGNRLRDKFGFIGTPISFYVSKAKHIHGQHDKEELAKKIKPKKD